MYRSETENLFLPGPNSGSLGQVLCERTRGRSNCAFLVAEVELQLAVNSAVRVHAMKSVKFILVASLSTHNRLLFE